MELITSDRGFYYNDYFELNEQHLAITGTGVRHQDYNIGSLSGNINDSLTFPEQTYQLPSPLYIIKFPSTYLSVVSTQSVRNFEFLLTVTNFGLNKVPGIKKSYYTSVDSVIGWGTLILPTANGKTKPKDVLLFKKSILKTDSIFLGGQPAPLMLLTAFGITQGSQTYYERYQFYTENRKTPLMRINFTNQFQNIDSYFFTVFDTEIGVDDNVADNIISVYPNLVSDGRLFVKTSFANNSFFVVYDIFGKAIIEEKLNNSFTQINLPDWISNGVYFYKLYNTSNQCSSGKFIVGR